MATLKLGHNLKVSHVKSDSEALEDLSSAFLDLDIDGEGLLDQASFLTALKMLGVSVDSKEMEKIFQVLDEEGTGMIEYDKLKEFMKMGKIPREIMEKVKSNGIAKRKNSIMFGASPRSSSPPKQIKMRTPKSSQSNVNEQKEKEIDDAYQPMDKQRVKMIQRAVIVIKKAAMKSISRLETIDFLKSKGMNEADVQVVFDKADRQVFNKDERINYLSDLAESRLNELKELKAMNDFISQQISTNAQEVHTLRDLLKIATDKLHSKNDDRSEETLTKLAAEELTNRIHQVTKDLTASEKENDEQASNIHKRDLLTLQTLSNCVTQQAHFHGFLYFHQLEPVVRDSMPNLQAFLQKFDNV